MSPIIKISKVLNSFGNQDSLMTKIWGFKILILSLVNRSNKLIKSLRFQNYSKDLTSLIKTIRNKQSEQLFEIQSPFQKMKLQVGKQAKLLAKL